MVVKSEACIISTIARLDSIDKIVVIKTIWLVNASQGVAPGIDCQEDANSPSGNVSAVQGRNEFSNGLSFPNLAKCTTAWAGALLLRGMAT
ncbi:MAG TPA: hypothetical protein VKQ29_12850 [Aliidongia sp.]|nr:hypothetical protein [Aliidongia sp.]